MTRGNEEKRYKKRPLVIVYYGIDFSFEHREGKALKQKSLFFFSCFFVGQATVTQTSLELIMYLEPAF